MPIETPPRTGATTVIGCDQSAGAVAGHFDIRLLLSSGPSLIAG